LKRKQGAGAVAIERYANGRASLSAAIAGDVRRDK